MVEEDDDDDDDDDDSGFSIPWGWGSTQTSTPSAPKVYVPPQPPRPMTANEINALLFIFIGIPLISLTVWGLIVAYPIVIHRISKWRSASMFKKFWPFSRPVAEFSVFNPHKAKVGAAALVDVLDYDAGNYRLNAIEQFKTSAGTFTDYELTDAEGAALTVRTGTTETLLLRKYDELNFDDDMLTAVSPPNDIFNVTDEGVEEQYKRRGPVITHKGQWTRLTDEDADGTVEEEEIEKADVKFWDYSRTVVQDGVSVTQVLIVELRNSVFSLWRGIAVPSEKVRFQNV